MTTRQAGHIANAHVACRLFYLPLFCPPGRVMHHSSCFSSPGYQTTDHTRGGVSFLLQFVSAAAACRSTLSHRSDRFRRVLSICPALQAGASPLFYSVRLHPFGAVLLLHTVMSHSPHHPLPQPLSARCSFLFCPAIMRCPIPGAASNLLCILSFRIRRPRG